MINGTPIITIINPYSSLCTRRALAFSASVASILARAPKPAPHDNAILAPPRPRVAKFLTNASAPSRPGAPPFSASNRGPPARGLRPP